MTTPTYQPRTYERLDHARVVVDVPLHDRSDRLLSRGQLLLAVHAIRDGIHRHVDLPYGGCVSVDVAFTQVCVHCGMLPEPLANGWPQCCGKAQRDAVAAGLSEPPEGE